MCIFHGIFICIFPFGNANIVKEEEDKRLEEGERERERKTENEKRSSFIDSKLFGIENSHTYHTYIVV